MAEATPLKIASGQVQQFQTGDTLAAALLSLAVLLAGRSGGQTVYGDTETDGELELGGSDGVDGFVSLLDGLHISSAAPAQITSDQNDYDLPRSIIVRLTTDAARSITGFAAPSPARYRLHILVNNNASDAITIQHNNAGSSAGNKTACFPTVDLSLGASEFGVLWYNPNYPGGTGYWQFAKIGGRHATLHQSGGGDAIKLDDMASPDDNTDLDASTSAHGLMPKGTGSTTTFYRSDLTQAAPVIVDWKYGEYTANSDLTTAIPGDDTIPTLTEATEIISVQITPKSATNKLHVLCRCAGSNGNTGEFPILAVNDGTTTLVASSGTDPRAATGQSGCVLEFEYVPGVTSEVDLNLRVGSRAGTLRLNGTTTGRWFGGVSRATMTVWEITA